MFVSVWLQQVVALDKENNFLRRGIAEIRIFPVSCHARLSHILNNTLRALEQRNKEKKQQEMLLEDFDLEDTRKGKESGATIEACVRAAVVAFLLHTVTQQGLWTAVKGREVAPPGLTQWVQREAGDEH